MIQVVITGTDTLTGDPTHETAMFAELSPAALFDHLRGRYGEILDAGGVAAHLSMKAGGTLGRQVGIVAEDSDPDTMAVIFLSAEPAAVTQSSALAAAA